MCGGGGGCYPGLDGIGGHPSPLSIHPSLETGPSPFSWAMFPLPSLFPTSSPGPLRSSGGDVWSHEKEIACYSHQSSWLKSGSLDQGGGYRTATDQQVGKESFFSRGGVGVGGQIGDWCNGFVPGSVFI